MQIARSVGPDWTHWTRDAGAIDSARQQLGQAINEDHEFVGSTGDHFGFVRSGSLD